MRRQRWGMDSYLISSFFARSDLFLPNGDFPHWHCSRQTRSPHLTAASHMHAIPARRRKTPLDNAAPTARRRAAYSRGTRSRLDPETQSYGATLSQGMGTSSRSAGNGKVCVIPRSKLRRGRLVRPRLPHDRHRNMTKSMVKSEIFDACDNQRAVWGQKLVVALED